MPDVKITAKEIETHMATLAETPRFIAAQAADLDADQVRWTPGKHDWSIADNLAHVRGCADVWTHTIYAMLAEDEPALPLFDPRGWAKVTRLNDLDFGPSLQAYTLQCEQLLMVLRGLPEAAWARAADIGGRQHTVFSQARRMALHEREHVEQIAALVERLRELPAGR